MQLQSRSSVHDDSTLVRSPFRSSVLCRRGGRPPQMEVLVDWASGRSEKLKGFVSKRDAEEWINFESSAPRLRDYDRPRIRVLVRSILRILRLICEPGLFCSLDLLGAPGVRLVCSIRATASLRRPGEIKEKAALEASAATDRAAQCACKPQHFWICFGGVWADLRIPWRHFVRLGADRIPRSLCVSLKCLVATGHPGRHEVGEG
ncbi:hypothetical protein SAMN05519103_06445 [Rhizobiales bacterium GAS113]|nr:hypothetical protein SAMN05519103_06445 [Rhizobiales bacterium GAS113]